jgi:hypothetical protein
MAQSTPAETSQRPPAKTNKKQAWVDTIHFALTECVRFQETVTDAARSGKLGSLAKDDLLYALKHSKGHHLNLKVRPVPFQRGPLRRTRDAAPL